MKKGLVHILLVGWLVIGGIQLQAQQFQIPNDFVVTQFGMDEGLPQSSVNEIIQSRDGYIWLATFGGLARFDGHSFTTFNRSNTKGMNFDRVVILFEDSRENIWVGTEQGIVKFKEGDVVSYVIDVNSSSVNPGSFNEDESGRIWVTLNGNPYFFNGNRFELKTPIEPDKDHINELVNDTTGIWLFLDRALVKSLGDSLYKVLDLSEDIETSIIDFIEYPDNSGNYFIGTSGDGVIRFDGRRISYLSEDENASRKDIRNFYIDNENTLWLNSYEGTSRWDGRRFVSFPEIESVENIDIQISTMLEDNEGNYWMGSGANGLFRLTSSNISMIDYEDGLVNQNMLSLSTLNDGGYAFATNCGGVYTYRNNMVEAAPINKHLPNLCIWSVFQDSKERIWFSSNGLYMTESMEKEGINFTEDEGFDGENVFAIKEDGEGNIWIGSSNGVYRYNESGFKKYNTMQGASVPEAREFFEDDEGTIWVGTVSGVFKIKDEHIQLLELSVNGGIAEINNQPYVRAIYKDEDGFIWIGTYGDGLFSIRNNEVKNITVNDGLFDDVISHLVEDEQGNFWMGSNRGISRVLREDLNRFLDGEIEELNVYSYGVKDGMNSAETNGGFQPNVIVDDEMNIYIPTVAGVAVVATRGVSKNEISPPVYVTNLRTPDGSVLLEESISLPYDTPFLEIDFTAVSFTDPEKVHFRYKLENLNEDWIEVGNRREALYSKIPPGNYTFGVIASNNDGVWNEVGDSFNLTIVPPFWMTTWFYSLMVIAFISTGVGVYYYRVQHLKREYEKQRRFSRQLIESQENERKRIASELHDGLGQQILVIKNRAELIKNNSMSPEKIDLHLSDISTTAQHSITDIRNIAHALRPVVLEKFGLTKSISNLCEHLERTSSLDWSYFIDDIDGTIPSEKEINLYRIVQEAVNNIEKHASASEASVFVRRKEQMIELKIWDDGKGFDVDLIKKSRGLGLLGMKERVDSLNGELMVDSNASKGTRFLIKIPIS